MNILEIEENLRILVENINKDDFIYKLLLAYGLPKASIKRLQTGNLNLSKVSGEIKWKKKLLFKIVEDQDLHVAIDDIKNDQKQLSHNPRFLIVTDFIRLLAIDNKTKDTLDIKINELDRYPDFFLPWAGLEKYQNVIENLADVKAAVKMAKMFDELKRDNPSNDKDFLHSLNIFLSRLLFCFFADDSNIFEKDLFKKSIKSHTLEDGSDFASYLAKLFEVLNTPEEKRNSIPEYLKKYPYVNGGLFKDVYQLPKFTRKSRQAIIHSSELNWSLINPDIFGSMMQAVVRSDIEDDNTKHYTSVPNIMKVIKPLFLDELYEEFEKAGKDNKKLDNLLLRVSKIKIFDPACGSGNFLIIAYKELRKLEMQIIKKMGKFALSNIVLTNFYGIEINDFACEIAQLSLWLAEHQMNLEFLKEFGRTNPTLPLKDAGKIVYGNACQINWIDVCNKTEQDEIFILGNPPYAGYSKQTITQKHDMEIVFNGIYDYKKLDYIATWFYKGADFIKDSNKIKLAYVTTNSICQGIQVGLLWPKIFNASLEIDFAYQPFKWENNAKEEAGVYIVIIGLQRISQHSVKKLYINNHILNVNNINPYLVNGKNIIINPIKKPLSKQLPEMISGLKASDDGNLIINEEEKNTILKNFPSSKGFIKRYIGAKDIMSGNHRYCIWVTKNNVEFANKIPVLKERFDKVRAFRSNSKKASTRKKASIPYAFDETNYGDKNSLVIPQTGSERRKYLPITLFDRECIISNGARVIYNSPPWVFGVISSSMHTLWVKAVAGRLKMDMQYSNTLCYNTFPFPTVTQSKKLELEQFVYNILEEREKYPEKTLAQLYDPDKMPDGLKEAHRLNDLAVERCYRSKPFESDEERLEYLFKLYEKMIAEEKLMK